MKYLIDEIKFAKLKSIPPVPLVAKKVIELLGEPEASVNDLKIMIVKDVGLTSKILKLANSAYYSPAYKIDTITQAIVMLGFKAISRIVIADSFATLCVPSQKRREGLKEKLLFEHSLVSAIAARQIALNRNMGQAEHYYIAGILHDIGKVVMNLNFPDLFDGIIRNVYNTQEEFYELERETFGFDHMDVGAFVAQKWNFSEDYIDAIKYHHNPVECESDSSLPAIIRIADRVSRCLCIGPIQNPNLDLTLDPYFEASGTSVDELDSFKKLVNDQFNLERQVFLS